MPHQILLKLMRHIFILLFVFTAAIAQAQNPGTLVGKLTDKDFNNDPLPFANVLKELHQILTVYTALKILNPEPIPLYLALLVMKPRRLKPLLRLERLRKSMCLCLLALPHWMK